MRIYVISGLGADHRAFQYIDFGQHEIIHLHWIDPHPKESLRSYALRMSDQIEGDQPFALLGLSFGGMLVSEMYTEINPAKTILLSSLGNASEKSWFLKLGRYLPFHHLIPTYFLHHPNPFARWLFGTKTPNEKKLLDQIISDGDPHYLKWAINAIIKWNKSTPAHVYRIHGTRDRMLHYRNIPKNHPIKGGGHFALVSHHEVVSKAILDCL